MCIICSDRTRNELGNRLKMARLYLRFVALQVVGRAFIVMVYQHWSPECPCKFLLRLCARLADHYRKTNDTRQVGLVLHCGGLGMRLGIVSAIVLSTAPCITSQ